MGAFYDLGVVRARTCGNLRGSGLGRIDLYPCCSRMLCGLQTEVRCVQDAITMQSDSAKLVALKKLLGVAASIEAATGIVLMIYPPLLSALLLGEGVSRAGMALGRVAGFALFSLGLACWPGADSAGTSNPALRALLTYNLLTTLYLAFLGLAGQSVGRLLWPAVALHAVLAFLLARAWLAAVGVEQVKQ